MGSGGKAGDDLTRRRLSGWRSDVADARRANGGGGTPRLPDHGVPLTTNTPFVPRSRGGKKYTNQAFLKFFGRGASRTSRTVSIADIVADLGLQLGLHLSDQSSAAPGPRRRYPLHGQNFAT